MFICLHIFLKLLRSNKWIIQLLNSLTNFSSLVRAILKNVSAPKTRNAITTLQSRSTSIFGALCLCVRHRSPVWARERCRTSPPRFLAECCKRQLNQGRPSFVLMYFRLFTFSDLYWVCIICIFRYCFVCQYHQSSDWLWSPPPKWPILCRVGR